MKKSTACYLHTTRAHRAKQSAMNVEFLNPDLENGPTSPLSLKRTFGKSEPIRVKLYRDHAAWCPYCHKVWLQLEEKQIPYTIEKINMRCYGDKPASFLAKVRVRSPSPAQLRV